MEEKKGLSCFIITPIGSDSSEIRRAADGVIETVIVPTLKKLAFDNIQAAHNITIPGSINKQVINRIISDDLVIANLTGLNANVMYELAVRHATKKPIIHICENGTSLPFDIIEQRTIFYINDLKGAKELEQRLEAMVTEILKKPEWDDNPIYNAITDKIIFDSLRNTPEKKFEQYLMERIESIEGKVNYLSNVNSKSRADKTRISKHEDDLFYYRVKARVPKEVSGRDVLYDILTDSSVNSIKCKILGCTEFEDEVEYCIDVNTEESVSVSSLIEHMNSNSKFGPVYS